MQYTICAYIFRKRVVKFVLGSKKGEHPRLHDGVGYDCQKLCNPRISAHSQGVGISLPTIISRPCVWRSQRHFFARVKLNLCGKQILSYTLAGLSVLLQVSRS